MLFKEKRLGMLGHQPIRGDSYFLAWKFLPSGKRISDFARLPRIPYHKNVKNS